MQGTANTLRGSPLCTDACRLHRRLPDAAAAVLDLGCGCGVPAARFLAAAGHRVTGVDISAVQVGRARRLVPTGTFLPEQPRLIGRIATWLRPGGWLLATVGDSAWTGTGENWLGGPAPMWWSQADASTYRSWLREAGLLVAAEEFVPEGTGGHALFWARRPPA
ncbi:class I SAM-dependent methyltransferase [Micromonospora carbonacea]|uniref:class I SAM-dependent methyltransferase n=1 Tax=Micromonospora carbonacea TaxID=47853 RepID=UPI003317C61D